MKTLQAAAATSTGTGPWSSQQKLRWSTESVHSSSSRASSSSSKASSSSYSSSRKSSRTSSSTSSSSSRGCNSKSSGSYWSRNSKPKPIRSCIRTVFPEGEPVVPRYDLYISTSENPAGLGSFDYDDSMSGSDEEFSCSGSEPSSPLSLSSTSASGMLADCVRSENKHYEAFWEEGNDIFERRRKSAWRKLPHRRLLTNLFNFKSRTGGIGLPNWEKPQAMLVDVHVLGSPGPIRLVVDKNDLVHHVVGLALENYAWQKRQPSLGLSPQPFNLYCQTSEFEAMDERTCIGAYGSRHFFLHPKPEYEFGEELNRLRMRRKEASTKKSSFLSWFSKGVSEVQSWGSCFVTTITQNFGCLASSLFHLNFDNIMCLVLKALR